MKSHPQYSTFPASPIEALAYRNEPLSEITACAKALIELQKTYTQSQAQQQKQEEMYQGQLMREIYRLSNQLSIPENKRPTYKAMTTNELKDYVEELHSQLKNRSLGKLSVA